VNALALAGTDLFAWLALRRVHKGGVAKVGNRYLDREVPVPGYVADVLDEMTGSGLLVVAEADPMAGGRQRIAMTETGQARYLALSEHAQRSTRGSCLR
jgi:hypothetical protein